ncbi:unnamed protein product [Paramecium pentaurelia]|uniref:Tetratricopeptide repeat protein n=1 Tax=Paramecium pentaurelia TaxID=43138 RepID=A0A8S1W8Y1_9CILI|nr:unnamed protein product [Paramecium pentaurelia]
MYDVEITTKSDDEILSLIRTYQQQGYQVWLQKRCSDKFLMQADYNTQGVLDLDNSGIFKSQNVDPKQFNEPSVICSLRKNVEDGHKTSTMEIKDTMLIFPRKTQTDLYSLLSPKLNSEREDLVKGFYEQLKEALHLEQFGQVKESIALLTNLVNELENQLIDSQILHLIFVESLLTLGILNAQIMKYSDAKMYLEKCLRLFVIKDQILLAQIYRKLGHYSQSVFSYQKSIDYYNQALIIYEIYNLIPEVAYTMMSIAIIYSKVNQFELASKIAYHALEINGSQMNKHTANLYQMLGEVYYNSENYTEALDYFDTSYDMKSTSQDVQSRIRTINFIASSCFHLGEYRKAQELFEVALSQVDDQNSLLEAQLLNNLGITKSALKLDSKEEFEKSLKIFLQFYPQNHPSIKRVLRNDSH